MTDIIMKLRRKVRTMHLDPWLAQGGSSGPKQATRGKNLEVSIVCNAVHKHTLEERNPPWKHHRVQEV